LISDQGELAICISTSISGDDPKIEAINSLDPSTSISPHIDTYLSRSYQENLENAKNNDLSISPQVFQLLSSVFQSEDTPNIVTSHSEGALSIFTGKKYKPIALKSQAVITSIPEKFRIKRNIKGNPLEGMPILPTNPPLFTPTRRYTEEHKAIMDVNHPGNFLWPAERDLLHHLISMQNEGFAWHDSERGHFHEDFFPPVDIPIIPHKPWVKRNILIPPGLHNEICKVIQMKINTGIYEPSNSSYCSHWFTVIKKDSKSLHIMHSLEPLNHVTIQHSGVPPFTDQLAEGFAGRACSVILNLYVGYDE